MIKFEGKHHKTMKYANEFRENRHLNNKVMHNYIECLAFGQGRDESNKIPVSKCHIIHDFPIKFRLKAKISLDAIQKTGYYKA